MENSRGRIRTLGPTDFTDDYSVPDVIVWATEVQCTGTEDRLDECFFPQQFSGFARSITFPVLPVGEDFVGVRSSFCARDPDFQVGVICRRFEVEGAAP